MMLFSNKFLSLITTNMITDVNNVLDLIADQNICNTELKFHSVNDFIQRKMLWKNIFFCVFFIQKHYLPSYKYIYIFSLIEKHRFYEYPNIVYFKTFMKEKDTHTLSRCFQKSTIWCCHIKSLSGNMNVTMKLKLNIMNPHFGSSYSECRHDFL